MEDRARVLALLQKHGWNATSFQVLEEGISYAFIGADACVAYADTGSAWVVAGAPVAAQDALGSVARDFEDMATKAARRVVYFGVEERFMRSYGGAALHIGEQAVWSAQRWQPKGSLKEQLRRARAKQVTVRQVDALDDAQVLALLRKWSATREMPPMGFLVDVQPFGFAEHRLYFVAERAGELVAFLAAVPIYARQGWLLEDLLRAPSAPNGTNELLLDAAMRAIAARGDDYVTLGLAPLSGTAHPLLRLAKRWSLGLYDFEGLRRFKAKLAPVHWEPIYLARPHTVSTPRAILEALRAFARGSLAGFALKAVLRGPSIVLFTLAALLIPWTALLAWVDSDWFPSPLVQRAWVAFDVIVCAALFMLARRYRSWLAKLLTGCVALDACLTAIEAATYNLPRAHTASDYAVIAVACAAPTFAALVLVGTQRFDGI